MAHTYRHTDTYSHEPNTEEIYFTSDFFLSMFCVDRIGLEVKWAVSNKQKNTWILSRYSHITNRLTIFRTSLEQTIESSDLETTVFFVFFALFFFLIGVFYLFPYYKKWWNNIMLSFKHIQSDSFWISKMDYSRVVYTEIPYSTTDMRTTRFL